MISNSSDLPKCNSDEQVKDSTNDSYSLKIRRSNMKDNASSKENNDEQINFINFTKEYCIGFIDIINSTEDTAKIKDPKKVRKYYSLFLNSMSAIIRQHNGKIIKNSGDNMFFYFPRTSQTYDESSLKDVFECSVMMTNSNIALNAELLQDNLPAINYRISMDYGMVEVALSSNKNEVDLFGSIVNTCAKINRMSKTNGVIIGETLHKLLVKSSFVKDYDIKQLKSPVKLTSTYKYNIYFVSKNSKKTMANNDDNLNTNRQLLSPTHEIELSNSIKKDSANILIIDDDKDILYTFDSLLKKSGYSVHIYSNPAEALKHLMENTSHNYDLVIMDIRMPDINGIKLFYWFKAIDPYMNILIVTALDLVDEFIDALPGINTNEIIRKPLSNEEFLSKIKEKLLK